jgi:hypothetical protein
MIFNQFVASDVQIFDLYNKVAKESVKIWKREMKDRERLAERKEK